MKQGDTVRDYLAALADRSSTPGGGAVAALSGAQGCALVSMVCRFTKDESLASVLARADAARETCLALAAEDTDCFTEVMTAWRLPKDERGEKLERALKNAADVPLRLIGAVRALCGDIETLEARGNPNLATDTGIAAQQFTAALDASRLNVLVNLRDIGDDEFCASAHAQLETASLDRERFAAVAGRITASLQS